MVISIPHETRMKFCRPSAAAQRFKLIKRRKAPHGLENESSRKRTKIRRGEHPRRRHFQKAIALMAGKTRI
jgi:hypothetical protein